MLILRTPKGWTGPKVVDGLPVEGTFRSHQLPLADVRTNPEHLAQLEAWLRSYRPEELFDGDGRPVEAIRSVPPFGERRMSANPHANGGLLRVDLELPDFRDYGVEVAEPGTAMREATRVLGAFLRDVMRQYVHLPPLRTGRDLVEPAAGRLRGHRPDVGRRTAAERRSPGP